MIAQGDVWWAELGEPGGPGPRLRRPVVVVQGDPLNRSRLTTAMCVPLSSNLRWARVPGCVQLSSVSTGLGRESVALGYRVLTLDKSALTQRTATLWREDLTLVLDGIDIALGA